jgi:hypothetical protein
MQIRGSKRGDKRSTWLIGHRMKGKGKYPGCVISLCLEEGGKREGMLLSMIGKYSIKTKGEPGVGQFEGRKCNIRERYG